MVYYYLVFYGGVMVCIHLDATYPIPSTTKVDCDARLEWDSNCQYAGKNILTCGTAEVIAWVYQKDKQAVQ